MKNKLNILCRWLVATFIDHLIFGALACILFFTIPYLINISINVFYIASYFFTMVYVTIYLLKDVLCNGNSFGKRKMGLELVGSKGQNIQFYNTFIRNISSLVLGIGSLFLFYKLFGIGNHFVKGDFSYFNYNPIVFFKEIRISLLTIVIIDILLVYFFSGRFGDLLGGTRIAIKSKENN